MAHWSISRRLISTLTLTLSGLWLLAIAAAALIVHHEINEIFDSALQESAQRILSLAADDLHKCEDDDEHERLISDTFLVAKHDEYLTYQVRNRAGRVLLRSHDAPATPFTVGLTPGYSETDERRFYTEPSADGHLIIQVAEPLAHRTEAISEGIAWLAAPLVLLVPLAGFAIWWTVRQATRPIILVREEISKRGGTNLAAMDDEMLPQELAPIIQDVNRLFVRLGRALEAERAFAANSAHELRTPVAAALAQAQRLAAQLAGSPQSERARQIASMLQDLGNLVEKLLQLSRAEAGLGLSRDRVDLMPVLELLVDEYMRRAGVKDRLHFDDGGFTELWAHTDIDAFAIALRNIIDNALIHSPKASPIRVFIGPDKAFHVVNGGPAVATKKLAKLKRRFARGAATASGFGLGLAIADTIMSQSGGSLEIRSPATGEVDGFEVVLKFS